MTRKLAVSGRRIAALVTMIAAIAAIAAGVAWSLNLRVNTKALLEKAEADLQAGRIEAAQACVRQLEHIRPPTELDRLFRARVASAAGDEAHAVEELKLIAHDRELTSQAQFMIGLIERRRSRIRYAEEAYRKAIDLDPRMIKARRELIYILGMQSRRRELDAQFKSLAKFAPLTQYNLYIWCLTHFVIWGSDSASDLESFIEADPDDRNCRLAMASLLLGQAGQDARIDELLKPLPPDDPEVLALLIEREINRGRVDEAAAMIARTNADDPRLARLRGRLAMLRGDRAGAVRYFRQALSDEPYDRVSNAELGKALLLQGDRTGSERDMTRARQLDDVYNLVTSLGKPSSVQQVVNLNRLARACESAGLLNEARGWYMLAIGQQPLDPEAQQGLHRIRAALPSNGPNPTPG